MTSLFSCNSLTHTLTKQQYWKSQSHLVDYESEWARKCERVCVSGESWLITNQRRFFCIRSLLVCKAKTEMFCQKQNSLMFTFLLSLASSPYCFMAFAAASFALWLIFSCLLIVVASRFIFSGLALFCSCDFTLSSSMFVLYVYKQSNLSFHWAEQFKQFKPFVCHRKSKAMQRNQEAQKTDEAR